MTKYRNKKTDGFDSKKEAARFQELRLLQRAGEITDLECQPKYELQPAFTRMGEKHRAITYTADFRYIDKEGIEIVEDVKSPVTMTQVYRIKKKLLLFKFEDFVFKEM